MSYGAEHIVYKKDAEGSTYAIGETVFENQIIQHDPSFRNISNILSKLQHFKTRSDDVWIIAYMKSGTHWLFEIINLLTKNAVTKPLWDKAANFLEMTDFHGDFEQKESPRILSTHFQLKFMPKHILNNSKIVFPLRNPKSVVVSNYYHRINITPYEYHGKFAGHLPDFMDQIDNLYGNWFDMVITYWEYLKGKHNVFFIVYEDLKKNPVECIKELSDFLGLDHDITSCERVAKESEFKAMRSREQESVPDCPFLTKQEGLIRKGSTTDWKTHFTVAQNEMFDAVYEEKMKNHPDLKKLIKFC